jgi:hypothetical protein
MHHTEGGQGGQGGQSGQDGQGGESGVGNERDEGGGANDDGNTGGGFDSYSRGVDCSADNNQYLSNTCQNGSDKLIRVGGGGEAAGPWLR